MNNDQFETYLEEEYKIKLDELLDQNDNHLNELLNQIHSLNTSEEIDQTK